MGLFKNPMVLMLGFTGLMAFAMPKMLVCSDFPAAPFRMLICYRVCAMQASMDLDPEEAKEMAQMQQRIKGFQNTDWSEKYVCFSRTLVSLVAHSWRAVCRLAGALAGKAAGMGDGVETVDAQSVKASGVSGSGNVNARRRKGR